MKLGTDVPVHLTYLSPRAFLICARDDVTSHVRAAYTNVTRDKKLCSSRTLKRVGWSAVAAAYNTTVILFTRNAFNKILKQ